MNAELICKSPDVVVEKSTLKLLSFHACRCFNVVCVLANNISSHSQ